MNGHKLYDNPLAGLSAGHQNQASERSGRMLQSHYNPSKTKLSLLKNFSFNRYSSKDVPLFTNQRPKIEGLIFGKVVSTEKQNHIPLSDRYNRNGEREWAITEGQDSKAVLPRQSSKKRTISRHETTGSDGEPMSQLTLLMKRMTANEEQLAIVRDNLFEERRLSSKYEKKIMALEKQVQQLKNDIQSVCKNTTQAFQSRNDTVSQLVSQTDRLGNQILRSNEEVLLNKAKIQTLDKSMRELVANQIRNWTAANHNKDQIIAEALRLNSERMEYFQHKFKADLQLLLKKQSQCQRLDDNLCKRLSQVEFLAHVNGQKLHRSNRKCPSSTQITSKQILSSLTGCCITNELTYFIDSQGCLLDKEQFYLLDEQNCCIKMTEQQVDLLKTKGMLLPVDKFC